MEERGLASTDPHGSTVSLAWAPTLFVDGPESSLAVNVTFGCMHPAPRTIECVAQTRLKTEYGNRSKRETKERRNVKSKRHGEARQKDSHIDSEPASVSGAASPGGALWCALSSLSPAPHSDGWRLMLLNVSRWLPARCPLTCDNCRGYSDSHSPCRNGRNASGD